MRLKNRDARLPFTFSDDCSLIPPSGHCRAFLGDSRSMLVTEPTTEAGKYLFSLATISDTGQILVKTKEVSSASLERHGVPMAATGVSPCIDVACEPNSTGETTLKAGDEVLGLLLFLIGLRRNKLAGVRFIAAIEDSKKAAGANPNG